MHPPAPGTLAVQLFGGDPSRRLALVRAAWPRAVGPEVARRSDVVAVEGGLLRVRVADAAWRRTLHRMQKTILARLADLTGGVAPRRLGFVEGPLEERPAPAAATPPAREPAPLPGHLVASADAIADPEIRLRFLAVAARYLDRSGASPLARPPDPLRGRALAEGERDAQIGNDDHTRRPSHA